jgi:type IV fimbrial biogenesis protein FimT
MAGRSRFSALLAKDRRFVVSDPLGSSAAMRTHSGFSLIELLVTLAGAAILIAAATPSLSSFFRVNRVAGATNELVLSLQLARAEAARRGRPVSVCRSADGTTCSGDWADGWIVFADANVTGTPSPTAAGAEVIRVFGALDPSLSLTGPDFTRFAVDGSIAGAAAELEFTLTVARCTGQQRRRIFLNRVGRVRSQVLACA